MNKGKLAIWIAVGLLLVLGAVLWGSKNMIVCWDGMEVDEAVLIDHCGITQEEYFSGEFPDSEGCVEESGAIHYIGSCDPDWTLITGLAGSVGVGYLVLSALILGIRKLVRRSK